MLGLNLFKCYHFYYSAGVVNVVVPIFVFVAMAFATVVFEVCAITFYIFVFDEKDISSEHAADPSNRVAVKVS